jgi:hypothetical protein
MAEFNGDLSAVHTTWRKGARHWGNHEQFRSASVLARKGWLLKYVHSAATMEAFYAPS